MSLPKKLNAKAQRSTNTREKIRRIGAIGGFLLLILLFLGPALAPGKVLLPLDVVVQVWPPWQQPNQAVAVHNPLITDVVDYIYPVKAFVAEQVKQGTLPLWNPYVLGGYPLTYNTQAGLFYPLSLFYYLLAPVTAVDWVISVQMVLGAVFMYAYLRLLSLRRVAAWAGGVVFLFNGMMVVWLEWQVVHAAVIWLPLQLFFVERVAQKLGDNGRFASVAFDVVGGGVAFALPWLGGHWNWALYGSLTMALYGVWRWGPGAWAAYRRREGEKLRLMGGTAVIMAGLGVGLSLIQLLPAFNYLRQGHRQPFTFSESLSLGLKESAVVALIPDFFGNPIHDSWRGQTNYNEITFYVGLLPIFLAVLALVLHHRDSVTRFFAMWGGLGLLWALGTPAYGLLYVLPVFDGLWPSRAMVVLLFSTAVLAAIGLDRLLSFNGDWRLVRRVVVLMAVAMMGMVGGFMWWYRPDWTGFQGNLLWFGLSLFVSVGLLWLGPSRWRQRGFAMLVTGWIVVDLFWLGHDYNTVGDVADLYPLTETAVALQADPDLFRITTLPQGVAYPPNSSLVDRLENMSGYEPAILQSWVDYMAAAEGGKAIYFERELMPLHGLDSPLIDALNVKYVVTISDWYQETPTLGVAQVDVVDWLPLGGETAVREAFTVPDAGLHRLDVPLRVDEGANGVVTIRVLTDDGGQELAHADWDVAQPLDAGWASFYFTAFPSEWGRTFQFTVSYVGDGQVGVGAGAESVAFRSYYLPRPQLVHEAGKTRIYLNEGYFPRAYVVDKALWASDREEALDLVQQNSDRLQELVILEADPLPDPLPLSEGTAASNGGGLRQGATITQYGLNGITMQVDLNDDGFVVLADTYYPGWRAKIDGEPAPVYRANSVVRAVAVPAGVHTVTFAFVPLDFVGGTAVTLSALIIAVIISLWAWRSRKNEN